MFWLLIAQNVAWDLMNTKWQLQSHHRESNFSSLQSWSRSVQNHRSTSTRTCGGCGKEIIKKENVATFLINVKHKRYIHFRLQQQYYYIQQQQQHCKFTMCHYHILLSMTQIQKVLRVCTFYSYILYINNVIFTLNLGSSYKLFCD